MWVERNGKTYRIRDLAADGRKVTVKAGYATKTAARAAMVQAEADKLRGDALTPGGGRVRLADWIDTWWPTYEISLKPSARHSEGSRVNTHIRPLLGHLALDDLDGLTVQGWVSRLLAGEPGRRKLAPKTVRNCHGILHKILGAAVAQRLIRANPCDQSHLPKTPHKEMRFLTEPEAGRLLAATPEHWRPLVLLLVSTGLRWGEAIALRVGDVDVLAGRLTVLRSMQELPSSGEIVFGEPKTARARRTVTFPGKTVGAALAPLLVDKDRAELVFAAPMGGPVRTRNFRRGWLKWTRAAGLTGLRIHDCRHTHAAWLISASVPLTAISRRLGHASIAVTSDLYGHLLPEVDEGIMAAVEAALADVDPAVLAAELAAELQAA